MKIYMENRAKVMRIAKILTDIDIAQVARHNRRATRGGHHYHLKINKY